MGERVYTKGTTPPTNLREVGHFISSQNLAVTLRDGIHRVLQNLILRDCILDQHRVSFNLQSNCLTNSYYRGLPAGEWHHGSEHVDTMLKQLSQILNSNKNFEMNDSFQLSFTHVCAVPCGTSKTKRKPGHSHPETFKGIKRPILL